MKREEAQLLLATTNGKLVLKNLHTVNSIFNELEELKMMEEDAQQFALRCSKELKAKDEEIERLKEQMTGWSMMFDEPQDAKARSIVAMLFWEWKSGIKYIESQYDKGIVEGMRYSFHKAYKMIKDNQC